MYLRRLPLFFLSLLAATAAGAQQMPAPQQQYLPQHQTLSYGVDWRVFPAGTATFHLESDGTTQRVQANGDSIGAVSLLFKVVDRAGSGGAVRADLFSDHPLGRGVSARAIQRI